MAKNKKPITIDADMDAESMPLELEESKEKMDEILEADWSSPTKLKLGQPYLSKKNPAYLYYKTIESQLAGWWEEFSSALDEKTGGPKYKTIHQFAQSKSKVPREQLWLEQMIGPEPAAFNWPTCRPGKDEAKYGKWLRVPWLGDWKARRLNGYWAPEHPGKIKSLVRSIKDKLEGFEAVQSAAPFLVQMMARYTRLSEQVDVEFCGQPLKAGAGPTEENKHRFYTYLEMQKALTRVQLRLLHEWMLVHGVSIDGRPVQLTQVNNMLLNAGQSPIGLADSMSTKDMEAVKLARMLQVHGDNFNLPPLTEKEAPQPQEKPHASKGNGKVM